MRRSLVALALTALAAPVVPLPAAAQPRPPANGHREVPLSFREAVQRLRSSNPDDVSQGIDALTVIGTAEVIPALVELIRTGLPDHLLESTIEKLGIIGRPEAIDELAALLHHRRAAVRQRVLHALGQIRDNRVRALLESGLRDSDAGVRGEAARALGETGARASVELLLRAFERNVPEAAEAIGRLGDAAAADRLLEALGRAPLGVLLPGFERFLNRRDIADPARLRIVEQLVARSPTQQVKSFLQSWVASLPAGDRSRSRARAELAIRQIRDTPPSGPAPSTPPAPAGGTP